MRALREDKHEFFRAASDAQKISDFVIKFGPSYDARKELEAKAAAAAEALAKVERPARPEGSRTAWKTKPVNEFTDAGWKAAEAVYGKAKASGIKSAEGSLEDYVREAQAVTKRKADREKPAPVASRRSSADASAPGP